MRGKYMRKLICCMLVAMMGVTQLCSVVSQAADISGLASESRLSHVLTLGADLSEDQKSQILQFFGIDQSEVTTITITNADEKEKLGNLISAEKIGSYTYSMCACKSHKRRRYSGKNGKLKLCDQQHDRQPAVHFRRL